MLYVYNIYSFIPVLGGIESFTIILCRDKETAEACNGQCIHHWSYGCVCINTRGADEFLIIQQEKDFGHAIFHAPTAIPTPQPNCTGNIYYYIYIYLIHVV